MTTDKAKEPEANATAPAQDKLDESQEQLKATDVGATPEKKDESGKQEVAAVQPPAKSETVNGGQKELKPKKPEGIVDDYLAKLGAIDIRTTVVKGQGVPEQETGAEAKPDEGTDEVEEIHWLDDIEKDVTPVKVIRAWQHVDQGRLLGDQHLFRDFKNVEEILNNELKTIEERVSLSTDLLARFCAYYNFSEHKTKAVFADYAIMIGKFLLAMKDFVAGARKKDKNFPLWGVWAAENLSFLGERRRQDYMALAERPDAINYSFFGVERLLVLLRITEHITGPDKIGTFLRQHRIKFDPGDDNYRMHDFKCEVDAAIAVQKAKENDLSLDPERVKKLIEVGGEVDRKMIADCMQIKECGGNPNLYLDARIQNRGKEVDYWVEEKLVGQIITMTNRLVKGFDKLVADPNAARKLEIAKIEPLETVIARLRQVLSTLGSPSSKESSGSAANK